jgi:hypothetical protein
MREIGYECYKSHGYYKYKIPIETLKKMADKRKWVHDFDTIETNDSLDSETDMKLCSNGESVTITAYQYEEYLSLLEERKALLAKSQEAGEENEVPVVKKVIPKVATKVVSKVIPLIVKEEEYEEEEEEYEYEQEEEEADQEDDAEEEE